MNSLNPLGRPNFQRFRRLSLSPKPTEDSNRVMVSLLTIGIVQPPAANITISPLRKHYALLLGISTLRPCLRDHRRRNKNAPQIKAKLYYGVDAIRFGKLRFACGCKPVLHLDRETFCFRSYSDVHFMSYRRIHFMPCLHFCFTACLHIRSAMSLCDIFLIIKRKIYKKCLFFQKTTAQFLIIP